LREKAFLSWVGLRGAVPIVLATFPLVARIPSANLVFNLVFFIVITSVVLQGTLIPQMARWLNVNQPTPFAERIPLEVIEGAQLNGKLREIQIPTGSPAAGKAIYELKLPLEYLIMLISRDGRYMQPNGSTVLLPGDILISLSDDEVYEIAQAMLTSPIDAASDA
jgi:cell volume regulation protein A